MYENRINNKVEDSGQVPQEILGKFGAGLSAITSRSVMSWSEHCTECNFPTCYASCEYYTPREDLKCRRFRQGMVRVDVPNELHPYLLKIQFKLWGKLLAPGNIRLFDRGRAKTIEKLDLALGSLLRSLPLPYFMKLKYLPKIERRLTRKWTAQKKTATQASPPSYFLLECYNPGEKTVSLSITMRPKGDAGKLPFQKRIDLEPGFNRCKIDMVEIERSIDPTRDFDIDLTPNGIEPGCLLYFGIMDFVHDKGYVAEKEKKCKCVVWDLDNTLWQGVLIEDGLDRIRLNETVVETIKELDRRGILQSIASKNNAEDVSAALEHFGICEYFLVPQSNWGPKSASIRRIAESLNIGVDTLMFVDDSPFEREEVQSVFPAMTVLDAAQCLTLPEMSRFQVEITAESAKRRQMYQQAGVRKAAQETFDGNYIAFLRKCKIVLTIKTMEESSLQRVHEITQRTNQMNFSGNIYSRGVLKGILDNPNLHAYVLDCEDQFGSYGTVGFCLVDSREPRMTDLMFSCRIQSKRVEHAFLSYLVAAYRERHGDTDFHADCKLTPRNAIAARVFEDLGFEAGSQQNGVTSYVFRRNQPTPQEEVVKIVVASRAEAEA